MPSPSFEIKYDTAPVDPNAPPPSAVPQAPTTQPPIPQTPPPPARRKHWSRHATEWTLGILAVVLLAIGAFVYLGRGRLAPGHLSTLSAITIPVAHAGDAFDVTASSADVAGLDPHASWDVKANVDVSAATLQQALTIVPAVPVDVVKTGADTFTITPSKELDPGRVYRLAIATVAQAADGTETKRDFSWAFQTKDAFRVAATIPGDKSGGVPLNTGIEFTLTQDNWVDPTPFFSITPAVKGHFEAHGRRLAFVPDQPFKKGTTYDVVLKKGFGLSGSSLALEEDTRIRFETTAGNPAPGKALPVRLSHDEFFEVRPKAPVQLDVYLPNGAPLDVEATAFRLGTDAARTLLTERLTIPDWKSYARSQDTAYDRAVKAQTYSVAATLTPKNDWSYVLMLPTFNEPGMYAVRLMPHTANGQASWVFYQVTNAATYAIGDKDALDLWVVNADTKKPLSHTPVVLADQRVETDAQGVAMLKSPSVLTDDTQDDEGNVRVVLAEVGEAPLNVFLPVRRSVYGFYDFGWGGSSDTWTAMYIDRPLYHPDDQIFVSGVARDRETGDPVQDLTVTLASSDWSYAKDYETKQVTTDANGRYAARFEWRGFSSGYYQVRVMRGDKQVDSTSFEVRSFAKPTYAIQVVPEQESVFDGEELAARVSARLYEGTPLARTALHASWYFGWPSNQTVEQDVTLDENGEASVRLPTAGRDLFASCAATATSSTNAWNNCAEQIPVTLSVRPATGEEGEIVGSAPMTVWSSSVSLRPKVTRQGKGAELSLIANRRTNDPNDMDGLAEALDGQAIAVTIIPEWYESVPDGTGYDAIEKKTYAKFRSVLRTDAPIQTTLTTNAEGRARFAFPTRDDRWYVITLDAKDPMGRLTRTGLTFSPYPMYFYDGGERGGERKDPTLLLEPGSQSDFPGYSVGQTFTATYALGTAPLDADRTPGVFFVVASNGIRQALGVAGASHTFTFDEKLVPNAEVRAVTWRNNTFEEVRASASLNTNLRTLDLSLEPDQVSYAPGGRVTVKVRVRRHEDGSLAAGETFAFAAVDRALLDIVSAQTDTPLYKYYRYVTDGVLFRMWTHGMGQMMGGAEKGGGGGGDGAPPGIRRNFKDTAASGLIQTDGNGEAVISFIAPDNLTRWRVEVTGVTKDGYASAMSIDVPVRKPVFVDVVVPQSLLATDKPVLKLRAYGSALPAGSDVTYAVDAPTLKIVNQKVQGKAGEAVYVALDRLVIGRHKVVVKLDTAAGRDGIERNVSVVGSYVTRSERIEQDATPGATLPETLSDSDVLIMGQGRSRLLPLLYDIEWRAYASARADAKVAGIMARALAQEDFGRAADPDAPTPAEVLNGFQNPDGGIQLLPYGSSDLEWSSAIAAADPDAFDRGRLASYFWQQLEDTRLTREMQLQALAGLAALGEPALTRLQTAASLSDLTWHERLLVVRGLEAAGDRERAVQVLGPLLEKAETRDNLKWLPVSGNQGEVLEATAEAAALAARVSHPDAGALMDFVTSRWSDEVLPILPKIRYLAAVAPTLVDRNVTVTYEVKGKQELATLKRGFVSPTYLRLTPDEVKTFKVVSADGPASIVLVRETSGRPASVPDVTITRSYTADKPLSDVQEGDLVMVHLKLNWTKAAQDGCYLIRDFVPGAWVPVVDWAFNPGKIGGYPLDAAEGTISFFACKWADPIDMSYAARVVSRGTFTAAGPLVQHVDYPSIASSGPDQVITVK